MPNVMDGGFLRDQTTHALVVTGGGSVDVSLTDPIYAADPTGVADSSAALLKALDHVAGNGSIFVPKGTYLLNAATATNGTGTTTNTSTSVTGVTGTWYKGATITGTGIPASTVVNAVSGTTLTISQAATASGTVTLSNRNIGIPLPPSATGIKIYGAGMDLTTFKLSSGTKRLFDFFSATDYETFQNIEISDFTVDAAGQQTSGNEHVVIGSLIGGTWAQRINITNNRVRRVKTVNVRTSAVSGGGDGMRYNVSFGSLHLTSGETQTNITNNLVEDCNFSGGNYAVNFTGYVNTTDTCEVYHDRNRVLRTYWDSGHLGTAHGTQAGQGAFVQFGGYGFGDTATVRDCTGIGSGDVWIESDAHQMTLVERCRAVDGYNTAFYANNFRAPANLATQKFIVRDSEAAAINLDPVPGTNPSPHFQIAGDSSTAARIFGEYIIENCVSRWDTPMAIWGPTGGAVPGQGCVFYMDNTRARAITINGLQVGFNAIACSNAASRFPVLLGIKNAYSISRLSVDGLHIKMKGTRSGAGDNQYRVLAIHAGEQVLDIRNVTFDLAEYSGIGTLDTFYWVISNDSTTTIRGSIRGVRALTAPAATSKHNGVWIGSSGTVTIGGKLFQVGGCDFSKVTSTGATQLDYNINANQLAKVQVTDYAGTRSGGQAVDATIASATTTTLAPVGEYFTISGTTTITSVTASWPGRRVTLVFSGILTFTDGSNLLLAGNMTTSADDTITLICDGTNWIETGRSVN